MKKPLVKRKGFAKKIENVPEKNIKLSKPFEPFYVIWNLNFSPSANQGGQHFLQILPPPSLPTILVLLWPWFYKPIKRHPNNINWTISSVVNFEHVFVSWGIFKSNHSEKLWKMTLLKHLNFQGNMWRIPSKHFLFSKASWRRLQRNTFRLPRRLERQKNVTLKTSWRGLQDVFSTSSPRRIFAGFPETLRKDIPAKISFFKSNA